MRYVIWYIGLGIWGVVSTGIILSSSIGFYEAYNVSDVGDCVYYSAIAFSMVLSLSRVVRELIKVDAL